MAISRSFEGGRRAPDSVTQIASISQLPPATGSGRKVSVTSYHAGWAVTGDGLPKGGSEFVDAGLARHNGGTIIDPNRAFPTDWNDEAQKAAWFADSGVDAACWKMKRSKKITASMFGMRDGVTENNTKAWAKLIQSLSKGSTVNFEGLEYRVFDGVAGLPSSGADPATSKAISESELPRILNKKNIKLKNGTVYVANQKTAAEKSYFPSTLTIQESENIVLEDMTLESKGESYGDADASFALDSDGRMEFLPYNSGNALLISRSRNVTLTNSNFRLCGSVGALYITSSARIKCNGCFAVAASLGYAGYAVDAWCGQENVTGFRRHDTELTDCSSHKEALVARDTLNPVGSSDYGSKGCLVAEDASSFVSVHGGYFADAFPNGSARDIGNAFTANTCEVTVDGALVDNCASVGMTLQSANSPGKLLVSNVIARNIRKTMHQVFPTSFSEQRFEYDNCDVEINNSGVWPGDGNRAREYSSVVANMKSGSSVYGKISNSRITGAQALWINDDISYGYLMVDNSYIETDGWLAFSNGWGGAGADYSSGVFISDSNIKDISSETDAYLQYSNLALPASFSHINLNFSSSTLTTSTVRAAYQVSINGSNLVRTLIGFDKLYNAWSSNSYIETGVYPVVYKEQRGLSGSNRRVVFEYPNRIAFRPSLVPDGNSGSPVDMVFAINAVGAAVINSDGNVEQEWFIADSGLTLWSADSRLPATFVSAYPTIA